MDADGSERRATDRRSSRGYLPRWSPDGSLIIFSSTRGGSMGIWVMAADGSKPMLLESSEATDAYPDWVSDTACGAGWHGPLPLDEPCTRKGRVAQRGALPSLSLQHLDAPSPCSTVETFTNPPAIVRWSKMNSVFPSRLATLRQLGCDSERRPPSSAENGTRRVQYRQGGSLLLVVHDVNAPGPSLHQCVLTLEAWPRRQSLSPG